GDLLPDVIDHADGREEDRPAGAQPGGLLQDVLRSADVDFLERGVGNMAESTGEQGGAVYHSVDPVQHLRYGVQILDGAPVQAAAVEGTRTRVVLRPDQATDTPPVLAQNLTDGAADTARCPRHKDFASVRHDKPSVPKYFHARGEVVVSVPCFRGPRWQR